MRIALVALLSWSPVVTAGPSDGVRWTAPVGCPDAEQMRARIGAAGGVGRLEIEGVVAQEGEDAWRVDLSLRLDGQADTRVLRGRTCDEVSEAVELLIAVRRDEIATSDPPTIPESLPPPPDPDPTPELDPTPAVVEPPPAAPPRDPSHRRRSPPNWPKGLHLGGAAGLGLGAAPIPGVPVELVMGGSWPRLRVALRGRYSLPRAVSLEDGRTARIQVGTASVEACARPGLHRMEFPVCGQFGFGGSRADGGGPQIRDRSGPWAELGVDAGVAWHLHPSFALTARLGAAAVLMGIEYVRGDELVFAPSPVHGRAVAGMEFHIPIQIRGRAEKR